MSKFTICDVMGHKWEYTEEYANSDGHVQADKVCTTCGKTKLGWTGPTVQRVEDACDIEVPSKSEAYDAL